MTKNSLTPDQLQRLLEHKKKVELAIYGKSLFFPIIFFVLTLIPTKYMEVFKFLSRRGRKATLNDSTFIEDVGVFMYCSE